MCIPAGFENIRRRDAILQTERMRHMNMTVAPEKCAGIAEELISSEQDLRRQSEALEIICRELKRNESESMQIIGKQLEKQIRELESGRRTVRMLGTALSRISELYTRCEERIQNYRGEAAPKRNTVFEHKGLGRYTEAVRGRFERS